MGDDRGFTAFRFILEALVAIALVGTFFIYGYPGNAIYSNPGNTAHGNSGNASYSNPGNVRGPTREPAEIAKLAPAR
jgi:hypothetical protein